MHQLEQAPLEAKSPFELRVDSERGVPESDVRTALLRGHGLPAFLHNRIDRRWSWYSLGGVDYRLSLRCLYCHNPDTWVLTNGSR